jgi:hypothetical protein
VLPCIMGGGIDESLRRGTVVECRVSSHPPIPNLQLSNEYAPIKIRAHSLFFIIVRAPHATSGTSVLRDFHVWNQCAFEAACEAALHSYSRFRRGISEFLPLRFKNSPFARIFIGQSTHIFFQFGISTWAVRVSLVPISEFAGGICDPSAWIALVTPPSLKRDG